MLFNAISLLTITKGILGKSHHSTLISDFMMDGVVVDYTENSHYRYNFHKGNYTEMRRELALTEWNEIFEGKSLHEKYEVFVDTVYVMYSMRGTF